ncbi:MAG TPA: DUF1800 domain-containing protein [Ktedonobacterales bacterium]|nr:DUF1800 domain-containing protein [Ktedonobacterales bacterium]
MPRKRRTIADANQRERADSQTPANAFAPYDDSDDSAYRIFDRPTNAPLPRPRQRALARQRPDLTPAQQEAFEEMVDGKLTQYIKRQAKHLSDVAQRTRQAQGLTRGLARGINRWPQEWRLPQQLTRRQVAIGLGVTGALAAGVATGVIAADLSSRPALARFLNPEGSAQLLAPPFVSDEQRIAHLLRRVGFGAIPGELEDYLKLGVNGAIEHIINYAAIPDDMTSLEKSLAFDLADPMQLAPWFLARMVYSKRPLQEKMTLFWHGLLTGSYRKLGNASQMPLVIQQNETIRARAMGRFDDLIWAITIDPIMLYWLDGHTSTGSNPNENYARELMELFTMGIGHYTQADVHYGALALTGWTVVGDKAIYLPTNHYSGVVTYLGHTGHMGVSDVVRLVCAHPATGAHLAAHLWTFFISDTPSEQDLKPLVDAYYKSNHSIGAMVRALLASPALFDPKTYRARVKSPAEYVVSVLRCMGITPGREELIAMARAMDNMGQSLFDPPNVAGWPGDKVSGAWVSTQAWMARANFVNALIDTITIDSPSSLGFTAGYSAQGSSHGALIQRIVTSQGIQTPEAFIDYFSKSLIDGYIGAQRRSLLIATLKRTGAAGGGTRFTRALDLGNGVYLEAQSVREALYLLLFSPDFLMN